MNRILARQLRKFGLETEELPKSLEDWQTFLARIEATYKQYDEDRYLLERSIEISSREMNEKIKKIKEMSMQIAQAGKMVSLGTLASGVAHEINNPLAGIRGYAEALMGSEKLSDPGAKHLDRILHLTDRIGKTVRHLLKLSRQSKPEDESHLNLTEALNDVLDLSLKQLEFSQISVNVKIESKKTLVEGEHNGFIGVLQNLISNSRDAFVTSGLSERQLIEIRITDSVKEGYTTIIYRDNAGGIDPTHIEHIFDPFYTTKQVGSGTGLGLSLSEQTVKNFGGLLKVETEKPYTTFTIHLKTFKEASKAAETSISTAKQVQGFTIVPNKRPKTLLVDDEEDICSVFFALFNEYLDITCFTNPVEALGHLSKEKYELVITDLKMPVISGHSVAQMAHEKSPGCKVIVMSGHVGPDLDEELLQCKPYLFIEKPLPPKVELITIITNYIEKSSDEVEDVS